MDERHARVVTRLHNLVLTVNAARPGCVQMFDLINNRIVLTSEGRISFFAEVCCDSDLLTSRGIICDTTMKMTQIPALGGTGPVVKLYNSYVMMVNPWGKKVNLDAVECVHGSSTAAEINAMLAPWFRAAARLRGRERCGVPALVTDQSISLDDGMSQAWSHMRAVHPRHILLPCLATPFHTAGSQCTSVPSCTHSPHPPSRPGHSFPYCWLTVHQCS